MKNTISTTTIFSVIALYIGVFGFVPTLANAQYYDYGYSGNYYDSSQYPYYTPTIYGQGYSYPTYSYPSYSYPYNSYNGWYTPSSGYSNPYSTCATYCYPYNYQYSYPYYNNYNQYYYNQPLSVTCSPTVSTVEVGNPVTWSATASGGPGNYWGSNGNYTFTWSGESIIPRNSNLATAYYNTPGLKTAAVTVYSNGQTVTQNCGTVSVTSRYIPRPWGY